ncbi:hypothetical protein ACQWFT_24750, partial [Salmonella enterica subsp. enterica serovar Infantis]
MKNINYWAGWAAPTTHTKNTTPKTKKTKINLTPGKVAKTITKTITTNPHPRALKKTPKNQHTSLTTLYPAD